MPWPYSKDGAAGSYRGVTPQGAWAQPGSPADPTVQGTSLTLGLSHSPDGGLHSAQEISILSRPSIYLWVTGKLLNLARFQMLHL